MSAVWDSRAGGALGLGMGALKGSSWRGAVGRAKSEGTEPEGVQQASAEGKLPHACNWRSVGTVEKR